MSKYLLSILTPLFLLFVINTSLAVEYNKTCSIPFSMELEDVSIDLFSEGEYEPDLVENKWVFYSINISIKGNWSDVIGKPGYDEIVIQYDTFLVCDGEEIKSADYYFESPTFKIINKTEVTELFKKSKFFIRGNKTTCNFQLSKLYARNLSWEQEKGCQFRAYTDSKCACYVNRLSGRHFSPKTGEYFSVDKVVFTEGEFFQKKIADNFKAQLDETKRQSEELKRQANENKRDTYIVAFLSAGVVGLVTFFSEKRIQKDVWKRDLAMRGVKEIYAPIYKELDTISWEIDRFRLISIHGGEILGEFSALSIINEWATINSDPILFALINQDKEVLDKLSTFYEKSLVEYQKKLVAVNNQILDEVVKPFIEDKVKKTVEVQNYGKLDLVRVISDRKTLSNFTIEYRPKDERGAFLVINTFKLDEIMGKQILDKINSMEEYKRLQKDQTFILLKIKNIQGLLMERIKNPIKL